MRILIVYRHFWPDSPPYASMLRSIAGHLVAVGHEVTVLCEQPCYKETDSSLGRPSTESVDGVTVHRLTPMLGMQRLGIVRQIDKVLFPLRAYFYCAGKFKSGNDFDLVWTATIPPVLSGISGARIAKKQNAQFLYHCQDLYPEIAVHSGIINQHGFVHRVMKRYELASRSNADILVSLSNDMKSTIEETVDLSGRHVVLNNFMLEDFSGAEPFKKNPNSKQNNFPENAVVKIIFAGNIGRFQGLEAIVCSLKSLGEKGNSIHLLFLGSGKALSELKEMAQGMTNVSFISHLPYEEARGIMLEADYGVVSLEPGIYKYAFPSKTLTYLGLSLPVVAIVENDSCLAASINKYKFGVCSRGRSQAEIATVLSDLLSSKDLRNYHRANAEQYFNESCSREIVMKKWASIIHDVSVDLCIPLSGNDVEKIPSACELGGR